MIGGEAAEQAALARRHVESDAHRGQRDPYELGWVVDWLYGDAVLPPMPLPRDPESLPRRRPAVPAHEPAPSAPAEPRRQRRRRARQLALL